MPTDVALTVLLAVSAFLTAAVSAVIGMGGGITLLGVMTAALSPSLVVPLHGAVQLSSNLSRTFAYLKHVRWKIFLVYSPPLIGGMAIAVQLWSGSKLEWFKPLIGAFILAFLAWRRFTPKLKALPIWTYSPLGFFIGFVTIFVGATGPLIAPFFLREDLEKESIVATKAACQFWTHAIKIGAFLFLGFDYLAHTKLLALLILAVVLGTLFGKSILKRISRRVFLMVFEIVLSGIALYLLFSGLPRLLA